jgi:hypothetical protein
VDGVVQVIELNEEFELEAEDWYLVQMARQTARMLLQRPEASPEAVICLGRALFALDRLPLPTERVNCTFGATLDIDPDNIHGAVFYMTFVVATDKLAIESGGYEQSPIGGDSFSYPGYIVNPGGGFHRECDPQEAMRTIQVYLDDGGRIEIEDHSDFDITEFRE